MCHSIHLKGIHVHTDIHLYFFAHHTSQDLHHPSLASSHFIMLLVNLESKSLSLLLWQIQCSIHLVPPVQLVLPSLLCISSSSAYKRNIATYILDISAKMDWLDHEIVHQAYVYYIEIMREKSPFIWADKMAEHVKKKPEGTRVVRNARRVALDIFVLPHTPCLWELLKGMGSS